MAVLILAMLAVTGCSTWDPEYKQLDAEGKTVSVRFDANGGIVSSKAFAIVDAFDMRDYKTNENGMVEISLIDPESSVRTGKEGGVKPTRTGYFLAGWYRERTPRVDEAGNRLDDFGQIIPEGDTTTEQGYIYSGKWDFETDILELDPNQTYTSANPQLTLYAAWIPYFSIEFYAKDDDAEVFRRFDSTGAFVTDASAETNPTESETTDGVVGDIEQVLLMQIVLPTWNQSTGKQDMNNIPKRAGMTFEAAYMDEAMTEPAPAVIQGPVDYERGICTSRTVKIYTTWKTGEWFHIYNTRQLTSNARLDGHYLLCADLDFSNAMWPTAFATGLFKGSIDGDGHTISNVTVTQGQKSDLYGGLFGILADGSAVRNVTFENVTYRLTAGSNKQGATFGTFVGQLRKGAVLENVTFNGTLEIGAGCWPQSIYDVNILVGSGMEDGQVPGVTHQVSCVLENPDKNPITHTVDPSSGEVTLDFPTE